MPHSREELRVERRHLRLGFADETVLGWMAASGLDGAVAERLPATGDDKLGVTIWLAIKPAVKVVPKNGTNPNFGMNMPLMSSAFDTSMWLNAA